MAIVLLAIIIVGLLLIATETFNRMNKAAVAMFAAVCCWMIYIAGGTDFVVAEHPIDFLSYVASRPVTFHTVKEFIADQVFLRYAAKAADIVLYLLATTTIVEVLNNNGCFDFLREWLQTRNPARFLWLLAILTFLLSANLDNLATAVLMLGIVHPMLSNDKSRRIYGVVIVLAANCGGAITVIGDMTSLKLWTEGLVTPTPYFAALVLPVLTALVSVLILLQRMLPSRLQTNHIVLPYRGDDTLLSRPQRLLMLFVGIGGLWFIPTFHRITLMPPFVGAMCVLGLLWIVNEICNRQLLGSDQMVRRRLPMVLQYANLQNILFFIGLVLMFAALGETGIYKEAAIVLHSHNLPPILAGISSFFSSALLGSVPTLVGFTSFLTHGGTLPLSPDFMPEGAFWPMMSFTTALGGSMLATGTIAGCLLMRMEQVSFGWYFRHIAPKVLVGFAIGFIVLLFVSPLVAPFLSLS